MPKAPRRCPAKGCTASIRHTRYCPDHTPAWDVPSGWRRPPGWASDRRDVLKRDKGICYICQQPGADSVDHVTPQFAGGADRLDNYRAVHDRNAPHCHRGKTNRDRAL